MYYIQQYKPEILWLMLVTLSGDTSSITFGRLLTDAVSGMTADSFGALLSISSSKFQNKNKNKNL